VGVHAKCSFVSQRCVLGVSASPTVDFEATFQILDAFADNVTLDRQIFSSLLTAVQLGHVERE
jgi:hypothetical protein